MPTLTLFRPQLQNLRVASLRKNRVQSIDLLRGTVMIIMALDHVRDYFHYDAFIYQPTDLAQTSILLFFTRWITHFCAPIFVFLAGISARIYGFNKSKRQLSRYLLTRGVWLVFAEVFIVTLGWTFNPSYHIINLQVIWAIGISMIVLSALVYLPPRIILLTSILLLAGHNLLDNIHVPGNFLWAFLHEPNDFQVGRFHISLHYPVVPWIGIMALGYYAGKLYGPRQDAGLRKKWLVQLGIGFIVTFLLLRLSNFYGDAEHWSTQDRFGFTFLSLLNVTKYPPSLLYTLMTIGPALIFLGLAERPLNAFTKKITVFGSVPFFYYICHIYLIHLLAIAGVVISGRVWSDMILNDRVNRVPSLKGYGFSLLIVYLVWIGVVLLLYPCCRWFARFKKAHQAQYRWLSYV